MARVTGSHLISKALKLEGVKNIFGLAGDHILPILDVMADQDFRIIDTRHEQAAVHMADAWSRLTEQPGVCMYTTPGFANAIPGLTNAMHTEAPVISIAGCADMHDLGRGGQQEIDQVHGGAGRRARSWSTTLGDPGIHRARHALGLQRRRGRCI
jgi:acetolactate synthase-1/2/3 large subunit